MSVDAAGEARRLQPQSTRIAPTALTPQLVASATSIDGGLLLDPGGRCHAIGVILDGTARNVGDPARGSRYNSAIRYLDSAPPPCIILIVSADGMVELLPALRPQVSRGEVDAAVATAAAAASVDAPNLSDFAKAWERVKRLQFYLSDEQVATANAAYAKIDDYRANNTMIRPIDVPLEVHPDMSDSYFLAE